MLQRIENVPVDIILTAKNNDTDINNALIFSVLEGPSNGRLGDIITQINSTSARITYTPNTNFTGS